MGCWNNTCFISHLPIQYGEPIVMLLLRCKTYNMERWRPLSCYVDDLITPLGLPIYGTYDDYGSVENIKNKKAVVEFLQTLDLKPLNDYNAAKITEDNIQQVIYDLTGDCYQYDDYTVMHVMIKHNLYDLLMKHINDRIVINTSDRKKDSTVGKKFKNAIERDMIEIKTETEEIKGKEMKRIGVEWRLNMINYVHYHDHTPDSIQTYLLKKYYHKHDKTTFKYLKEIALFHYILQSLRSGYGTCSGAGSQATEMLIHRIVAQFIFFLSIFCNRYERHICCIIKHC